MLYPTKPSSNCTDEPPSFLSHRTLTAPRARHLARFYSPVNESRVTPGGSDSPFPVERSSASADPGFVCVRTTSAAPVQPPSRREKRSSALAPRLSRRPSAVPWPRSKPRKVRPRLRPGGGPTATRSLRRRSMCGRACALGVADRSAACPWLGRRPDAGQSPVEKPTRSERLPRWLLRGALSPLALVQTWEAPTE